MAWEIRGERSYYYRAKRENGRVRKEYVGTGELADLLAEYDEAERQLAKARERQVRIEIAAVLDGEAEAMTLAQGASSLVRASLYAAGYRQHKRGEWRRPRTPANRPKSPRSSRACSTSPSSGRSPRRR